ncbi:hypothetical protein [Methylocystis sp. SC2]|uniref:NMCC_0638 family (lipo)protein n=1 Tax=Methylocystis sp. (strain SC2) TaxID=187303 RepID=UPI00027AE98F|nr:hypothetical protein [Methylocystis sp. SC2]CCJ08577.1 Hypothetical protein BN69_3126 [Methylocystis sp. SC2]
MTRLIATLCVVLLLFVPVSLLGAPSLDLRAIDALELFQKVCFATDGSKDKIVVLFDPATWNFGRFKQLPASAVQRLQGGRPGGVAYAIISPNGAELLAEYESRGICGVRVQAADENSIHLIFDMSLAIHRLALKGETSLEDASTQEVQGYKTTFRAWRITPKKGKPTLVAITYTDRPGLAYQHFITLSH